MSSLKRPSAMSHSEVGIVFRDILLNETDIYADYPSRLGEAFVKAQDRLLINKVSNLDDGSHFYEIEER